MTISSSTIRNDYSNASGGTTFAYTFKIFDETDIKVITVSSAGVETVKTLTTDYTVTGVDNESGGNVVFNTAVPAGTEVHIISVIDRTGSGPGIVLKQTTDLVNETGFFQDRIEDRFDILCRQIQMLADETARSIRTTVGSSVADFPVELPVASVRANKVLYFDANGDPAVAALSGGSFSGTWTHERFTAGVDFTAGATTQLTLTNVPANEEGMIVTFDGVTQHSSSFSLASGVVTFDAAIPDGTTEVQVSVYTTVATATVADGYEIGQGDVTPDLTNAGARRLNSIMADVTNVLFYDVDPTGVTDSAPGIQQAIADAIASNKHVVLPAGTYLLNTALTIDSPDGMIFEGLGGVTLLTSSSNGAIIVGDGTDEQRHIHLKDFKIRSQGANSNAAITGKIMARSSLSRIIVSPQESGAVNYFATAFDLQGLDYVWIGECNIRATTYGVQARSKLDGTVGTGLFFGDGTKIAEVTSGTGVRIHGGLGGVVFGDVDILSCTNGVSIENSIGFTNREFFFSPTCTIDSQSNVGVVVNNGAATNFLMDGTWLGTCKYGITWADTGSCVGQIVGARYINGAVVAPYAAVDAIVVSGAGANLLIEGCTLNGNASAGVAVNVTAVPSALTVKGCKIQTWDKGIVLPAACTAFDIQDNFLSGIIPVADVISTGTTPDGLQKTIRDNVGFVTTNGGQAAMTNIQSSITVAHGLAGTPQIVIATPGGGDPGQRWWVGAFNATDFTISMTGTPAGTINWQWRASLYAGG